MVQTPDGVDAVVIGAGVVGLAVARALAQRGLGTLLLEAGRGIGRGVSSRSSEVIHAGLHDPPHWLKARSCVRGRMLLYEFCRARGVPHAACGKFVVATSPGQTADLEALAQRGRGNGVEGLRLLTASEAVAAEPALRCSAALHSTQTGIVDSHALMLALLGEFEAAGGTLKTYLATTGDTDFLMIVEAAQLDHRLMAALMVAGSSGSVRGLRTVQAFTSAEFLDAQKEAGRMAASFRPAG